MKIETGPPTPPSRKNERPGGRSEPEDQVALGQVPDRPVKSHELAAHCFPVVSADWLAGAKRTRAEQLTSYFENSTLELQYDYIENIKDGRGYTAGRAGFTTRTGDFLMVVDEYSKAHPDNPLQKYLPRLREIYQQDSDSTSGLRGIVHRWRDSCQDPAFLQTQDKVVEDLYFNPAMETADQFGLQLPLSRAVIYDTIIQHGNGNDHDGLPAICERTNALSQGTPASGVDEKTWLRNFLADRREVLMHAADPATQAAWRESVSRVDAFRQIGDAQNYALDGPIHVNLPAEDLVFDVA